MFYVDACKKSIYNRYYQILYFMCKVSQKMVTNVQRWCGKPKKVIQTNVSSVFPRISTNRIFFDLANWQNKENMAKESLIFVTIYQNIGHIYMLDGKQGIEEQHKPWELKKLSTWLYLTYFKENTIIPLVSQKSSHRFEEKKCSP